MTGNSNATNVTTQQPDHLRPANRRPDTTVELQDADGETTTPARAARSRSIPISATTVRRPTAVINGGMATGSTALRIMNTTGPGDQDRCQWHPGGPDHQQCHHRARRLLARRRGARWRLRLFPVPRRPQRHQSSRMVPALDLLFAGDTDSTDRDTLSARSGRPTAGDTARSAAGGIATRAISDHRADACDLWRRATDGAAMWALPRSARSTSGSVTP